MGEEQAAPPVAARRQVIAYGVGGGGDIGVVCAFIHGRARSCAGDAERAFVAVGAGYSLAQYRSALSSKIPGREDEWLRLLFSNIRDGGDPHFYFLASPVDRSAVDAIWGPGVDSKPSGFKYLTGIDELFIRDAMGVHCELALLHSVAFGKKYLAVDGRPCDNEDVFASEQAASLGAARGLLASLGAGPSDEHVLFDVGGDIVDFERRGRDSNLLLTLLRHFASLGAASPRLAVVILGLGCDGHAAPAQVAARLAALGFAEAPEDSAAWAELVAPMLAGLEGNRAVLSELQLLDSHKRATQLFLDARALSFAPFSFSEDPQARDDSIFGRGEISVRVSPGARPEEAAAAEAETRARFAQWRELLGEPGSERMRGALAVMRQVWVLAVGPGEAAALLERWEAQGVRGAA